MRTMWKGSISFGLVNIPVRMYTASKENELKFTLLHKKDHSEIRYARICKEEDKEVPWKDIVKGFEYSKGNYIVLTDDDFEKVSLEKSKTIAIKGFIDVDEIDTVYFMKPYFLEPEKGSSSAYALLREALRKSNKVGIASFVFHNREHLVIIKPYGNLIVLNELRHDSELLKAKALNVPEKEKLSSKELDIALKLIDQLTESFEPKKYQDTYIEEVKKMIAQKAKGKVIKSKEKVASVKPGKVHDIMSLLKASLETKSKKRKSKRIA